MREEPHKSLGRNVVPSHYKLSIDTNLKTFRFKGHVEINVIIKEPVQSIKLNQKELNIRSGSALMDGKVCHARVVINNKDQIFTMRFGKALHGPVTLVIDYTGINNDKLYGFYRSRYRYKGKDGYLLTTQFESTDARAAFPCFDEPEFKATFDLELLIDKDLRAISNMPIKAEQFVRNNRKSVVFHTTPRMSTYLLYMGVGSFSFKESRLGKLVVRVAAAPGKIAYTNMALDFTKRFVRFFNWYCGVEYPLPKLDIIAVPDFAEGAMENWGAITAREIVILGNEKVTSVVIKRRIAEVIAHEIAHQWFGDLVTMRWWNDLWLNESFATFMATKAVDSVFPKWKFGVDDYLDNASSALSFDQLRASHPISVHVNSPKEIEDLVDAISYAKGGSVLYMLEDYAGAGTFRLGLNHYLRTHAYANADKYDLWSSIQHAASAHGKRADIVEVASYWIDNVGYPMVRIRPADGRARLEQRRYLLLGGRGKGAWPIPLHYSAGSAHGFTLFRKESGNISMHGSDYVKLNYKQKGLYRVMYPQRMLGAIGAMIKEKKLSALDAWGVENDLYSFARSRRIRLGRYLDFIERYCLDVGFPLNLSISEHLSGLLVLLHGTRSYGRARALSIAYHRKELAELGWTTRRDDDHITIMRRSAAIRSLGVSEDRDTLDRARALFNNYLKNGTKIDVNTRTAVYILSAIGGNEATYDRLVRLFKSEHLPEEQRRLLGAISSFTSRRLIRKALAFSLSKDVRHQDAFTVPAMVAANHTGRYIIWSWIKSNWPRLLRQFREPPRELGRILDNLAAVTDERSKQDIIRFFKKKKNMRKDLRKPLSQTLEIIEANVRFLKAQMHA